MPDELARQVREFAGDLTDLLNATIVSGPPISAVQVADGRFRVGCGLTKNNLTHPSSIGLTIGRKPSLLYLHASHDLVLDDIQNRWLTVARTGYSVQTKPEKGQGVLFRYDYTRDVGNGYPEAHLHVAAPRGKYYDAVFEARDREDDALDALHFPVGGAQSGHGGTHYRPILEDIVEMLVLEKLVDARKGWQAAVAAGRKKFYETQLRAAVRRNPKIAEDALANLK